MLKSDNKATRVAFFSGLGFAVIASLFLRYFKCRAKMKIILILTQTASLLLLGDLAIRWNLSTLSLKLMWWWDVLKLNLHYAFIVDNLQFEVAWKSFWAYWDGFGTGAVVGAVFAVAAIAKRQQQ